MKIKELIKKLEEYDGEIEVCILNDECIYDYIRDISNYGGIFHFIYDSDTDFLYENEYENVTQKRKEKYDKKLFL